MATGPIHRTPDIRRGFLTPVGLVQPDGIPGVPYSEIARKPILIEQSDESQTAQSGLVHRFDMAIEEPPVGTIGMTTVDLIVLIDSEDMELSGGDAQTPPAGGVSHMKISCGLFNPITLEEFLKGTAPQGLGRIDPDSERLQPIGPRIGRIYWAKKH